jgi:hypothetical protein
MNFGIRILTIAIIVLTSSGYLISEDFRAYYTKINSNEEFERYSRTGPYADIVVEVKNGKFVFWRGSSYLPYFESGEGKWYVDEMIDRIGDGDKFRPDKVNTYSRVSIVELDEEKVVIYWRYLPKFSGTNPHSGVDATKFVEEYFTISNNGYVERRIKKGTEKLDDWKDPGNVLIQTFRLTDQGFRNIQIYQPTPSQEINRVVGSATNQSNHIIPAVWWKFDEGEEDVTKSLIGQSKCLN